MTTTTTTKSSSSSSSSCWSSSMKRSVRDAFSDVGLDNINDETISQCLAVIRNQRISPKQMAESWEAYSLNRNVFTLDQRTFPSFRAVLVQRNTTTTSNGGGREDDDDDEGDGFEDGNNNNNEILGAVVSRPYLGSGSTNSRNNNKRSSSSSGTTTTTTSTSLSPHDYDDDDGKSSLPTSVTPPSTSKKNTTHQVGSAGAPRSIAGGEDTSPASKIRRVSMSPSPQLSSSSSHAMHTTSSRQKDAKTNVINNNNNNMMPKYQNRKGSGDIVVEYVGQGAVAATAKDAGPTHSTTKHHGEQPRCTILHDYYKHTNVLTSYRHMFTTLEERAMALDRHLVQMGQHIIQRYQSTAAEDNNNKDKVATNAPQLQLEADGDENASSFNVASLEAVGIPRHDKVCCIGRICNSAHEGQLNSTSVLLEGSRDISGGCRVELDLSDKDLSYSLFPGQIVAVEGCNPSGRKMIAQKIFEGAAHEPVRTSVHDLLHYHYNDQQYCQNGLPIHIVTAAGPYTTSDNLEYEPLFDLLNNISKDRPDVVILMGPFVDMIHHNDVQSGRTMLNFDQEQEDLLVSYETIFATKVAGLLEQLYEDTNNNNNLSSLHTQFILVPSMDDAVSEWVYPQPPLTDRVVGRKPVTISGSEGIEIDSLGLHHVETAGREDEHNNQRKQHDDNHRFRRVRCVSNPCTIKINEFVVGISSTDVLFHMSSDETNANLPSGSRLGRIAQHMIQQRSYYPLFPPPPISTQSGVVGGGSVNLDLKHMKQWSMPCNPDILIIPSKLRPFARSDVDNVMMTNKSSSSSSSSVVVVNPGHLCRNTTGGTYANIYVHPIPKETLLQQQKKQQQQRQLQQQQHENSADGDDDNNNDEGDNGDDNEVVMLPHGVPDRTRVVIKRI